MVFSLHAEGSVTDCREALNAKIAALPLPYSTEHAVVRAIANHVVIAHLDPLHDPWQDEVNKARQVGLKAEHFPPEPRTSIAIDCVIVVGS